MVGKPTADARNSLCIIAPIDREISISGKVVSMHGHTVPNEPRQAGSDLGHAFLTTKLRIGMQNAYHKFWESGTMDLDRQPAQVDRPYS